MPDFTLVEPYLWISNAKGIIKQHKILIFTEFFAAFRAGRRSVYTLAVRET